MIRIHMIKEIRDDDVIWEVDASIHNSYKLVDVITQAIGQFIGARNIFSEVQPFPEYGTVIRFDTRPDKKVFEHTEQHEVIGKVLSISEDEHGVTAEVQYNEAYLKVEEERRKLNQAIAEEEARQDAMALYDIVPFYPAQSDVSTWTFAICKKCGVMVYDQESHNIYHETVDKLDGVTDKKAIEQLYQAALKKMQSYQNNPSYSDVPEEF